MPGTTVRMTSVMLATTLSVAAVLSAGCSSQATPVSPAAPVTITVSGPLLQELRVNALPDPDRSSATALDVLVVYDKAALLQLPKTGQEWFAQKQGLLGTLKGSVKLVSIQVPPGIAMTVPLPPREGMVQALVYANTEKQPVANISAYSCAQIMVSAGNLRIIECH